MQHDLNKPCRTKLEAAEDIAARLASLPRHDLLTKARLSRMLQTLLCEVFEDECRQA